MLEIKNISKTFNAGTANEKRAIEDLSITINDGDFITVIGGNGAGKSTLLNLISGTYSLDTGKVIINGEDVSKQKEYKRASKIGRVFQDPMVGTCADLSIEENFSIASRRGKARTLKKGLKEQERKKYVELIKSLNLGLESRLGSKVGLLSGGQRQALTLLMATLVRPELLLLDEHTAALDPKTANRVLTLTETLVKKDNLTTLMITHNMKDAIKYGNRLIMMSDGKIILDVSGEEKAKLTVSDLLQIFEKETGFEMANDRILLSWYLKNIEKIKNLVHNIMNQVLFINVSLLLEVF